MNCHECVDMMLEAEPTELTGRGDGALAEHLRRCASCRRTAASIVRDTRVLAGVVERRRPAWRRPAAVAALAAAGLLLAIGVRERGHVPSATEAAATVSASQPAPAVPHPGSPTRVVAAPNATLTPPAAPVLIRAARVSRRPIHAVAYQPAAFVATPIQVAAEPSTPSPMVTVRPAGGRRAAVFHTQSPGVTIVWLY